MDASIAGGKQSFSHQAEYYFRTDCLLWILQEKQSHLKGCGADFTSCIGDFTSVSMRCLIIVSFILTSSITFETFGDLFLPLENSYSLFQIILHCKYAESVAKNHCAYNMDGLF